MLSDTVQLREIVYNDKVLKFYSPNKTTDWRIDTFFSKEPSTVKWLADLKSTDVYFDVGANVGMYTVFAAINSKCTVYAFEPESQNYSLLCKNIYVNSLSDSVSPLCVAISNCYKISCLNLSRFDWDGGGSCHSFGEEVGFDLSPRVSPFKQSVVGLSLDELVSAHHFPSPTHLKIDVDGFEHLVIQGATSLFKNNVLKSICIELNTNLPQHNRVIDFLVSHGFFYYSDQIQSSMRKNGPFTGCSEFIFYRALDFQTKIYFKDINIPSSFKELPIKLDPPIIASPELNKDFHFDAFKYATQKIWEEDCILDPFPFVYINNLFPSVYYENMCAMFPRLDEMTSLSETGRVSYDQQRYVTLFNQEGFDLVSEEKQRFWQHFHGLIASKMFNNAVISKFKSYIQKCFDLSDLSTLELFSDSLLVRDLENYSIGPHTDMPARLVSMLFYMPDNKQLQKYGTSMYKPKDSSFECPGGPHYSFDAFEQIGTAPFLPNTLFMFVRTPKSFHGVEQILMKNIERKLLISNLRRT